MESVSLIEFLDANGIKWCPINVEIVDGKKDIVDAKWINQPTIRSWWEAQDTEIHNRIAAYVFDNTLYNYINIDTRNLIHFDIDIKNDEEFNKLTQQEKILFNYLITNYPCYKSLTKKYGYHIFICDITNQDLNKKKINYFLNNFDKLDCISDINAYKQKLNNETQECNYLKNHATFIEILKGRNSWAYCDAVMINPEKIKDKDFHKNGFKQLQEVLKDDYFKAPKKTTTTRTSNKDKKKKSSKVNKQIDKLTNKINENSNVEEIKDHIDNIDYKYLNEPNNFYKILGAVLCLKNNEILHHLKVKASKSTEANSKIDFESWFNKEVNKYKSNKKFPKGIIFNYSKQSNVEKFFTIKQKYDSNFCNNYTPYGLAKFFIDINKDNLLVSKPSLIDKSIMYNFNEKECLWFNQGVENHNIKKNLLQDILTLTRMKIKDYQEKLDLELDKEEEEQDNEMIKKYEKLIKLNEGLKSDIQGPLLIEKILKMIEIELIPKFNKKVEFDKLNYHLTFQNKIKLDVRTGEVSNIMREDYIETLLAYDYYEPPEEDYQEFVKAFESCFMDETYTDLELEAEHRAVLNDVIYIFATGLVGKQIQRFFIMNGQGGNGKSLFCDIYEKVIEAFMYKTQGTQLEKDINVAKPAPEWANLKNKRVFIAEEIEEDGYCSMNLIKTLTGNSSIKARFLQKNTETIKLLITSILICNQKPEIRGEINDAISRRMTDIFWKFQFKCPGTQKAKEYLGIYDDNGEFTGEYISQNGLYKLANTEYESDDWKEKMTLPMLKYILDWIKNYPDKISKNGNLFLQENYEFSQTTETRTLQYLSSQNQFASFMEEILIQTNNPLDIIPISAGENNIFKKYKEKESDAGIQVRDLMKIGKFKAQLKKHAIYKNAIMTHSGDRITRFDGNVHFNADCYLKGFYWRDSYSEALSNYEQQNNLIVNDNIDIQENEVVEVESYDSLFD